jgi:DNA polymerase III epsilon subunit-like protein
MMNRFRHIQLSRPLCVLDCETTGVTPQRDRIIEIAVERFEPENPATRLVRRVNPGTSIPASASAIPAKGRNRRGIATGSPGGVPLRPG